MKKHSSLPLFALCLAACFATPSVFSADKTWDGGAGNGTWTAGANWDSNVAPVATDSLFFAGATFPSTNNGFAANTQFNGLTFNAGASSFTLAGNAINLAGNIANVSSNNQTISLALALQQNVTVNSGSTGNATSGGTTLSGIISGGFGLEKTGSGRLALTNTNTFSGGIRVNNGTLAVNNSNTAMGTGTVTLGSVAGTENVLLSSSGGRIYANSIVVGAGSGTRTIVNALDNMGLTGRISLFNDLILDTAASTGPTRIDLNVTGTGGVVGSSNIIVRNSGAGPGVVNMAGNTIHRASFTGGVQVESGATFGAGNGGGQLDIAGASVTLASGANFTYSENPTIGGLNGVAGSAVQMTNGSGTRTLTLGGSGTYSYAGNLNNPGAGLGALTVRLNYGGEKGTQTFSGNNSLTGATALQAGKFILDYSTNNTSKLNDTGVLTLRGGTLELSGGNHTETVASTTIVNAGMVNIARTGGNATLALGNLTWSGAFGSGALNLGSNGTATTTTGNTRGILGDRARFTVGGANWATNDANNIVALASYDTFVGTGGNSTNNYLLSGSGTVTANQAFNTLKIATTGSGQSLALGNRTLGFTNFGLLVTGTHDYSITTSEPTGAISSTLILHNYGSGVLSLGRLTGESFQHAGNGTTVLTTASGATTSNANTGLLLDSGTLQFSANNQIAGNSTVKLSGGTLVANTTGGNITLTNNSVGGHRAISLGTDVPVIDVRGGNVLTLGGVISSADGFVTPLVFGGASSNGTIQVFGNNTYTGDTRLAGGRISVNSDSSLGNATVSNAYKVVFSGNSTLNTTANIATNRSIEINSGVTGTIETDASTTLTHNGTIAGAGNLRKTGTGTLTISGTSTYTGNTTISSGTLLLTNVSGSATGNGTITVSSGAVLGGSGSASGATTVNGGTVGTSGSTLALTGTLASTANSTIAGGSTVNVTGGTTVTSGLLAVNGTLGGATLVSTGATLGGNGSVSGATTINGNLTPGNSPGLLNFSSSLTLTGTSITTMEINGDTVRGTNYDGINVAAALAYGGNLTLALGTTFSSGNYTFDLFQISGGQSGSFAGVTLTGNYTGALVNNGSGVWGLTSGDNTWTFTQSTGDLGLTVVPEPSTWALVAFSLTAAVILRRRRSQA